MSISVLSLHRLIVACWCFGLSVWPITALADTIEQKLPQGLSVTADYQAGSQDHPALLLLHGFLQTADFPLIAKLSEALSINDYAVLAPTLSLGVNRRKQGLPCHAIHTHTMDSVAEELAFWVHWLEQQGYTRVILIGHSLGGLNLIEYVSRRAEPENIAGLILISLTHPSQGYTTTEVQTMIDKARQQLAAGKHMPAEYALAFCKKYPTLPEAYLSYAVWDEKKVLATLQHNVLPIQIILGGADDRMSAGWIEGLKQAGMAVQVIPGGNHFFDGAQEFDLIESVENSLTDIIQHLAH